MFESLKYIQRKFPYFLDMTEDSNNYKVTQLIDDIYIDDCNSLEKVRDGYYYNHHVTSLDLDRPVIVDQENTLVFKTTSLSVGDLVSFTSSLFGDLGTVGLTGDDGDLNEHINIFKEDYLIRVIAKDIKSVTVTDLVTSKETVNCFEYEEHRNSYESSIGTSDYCVTVETWNEYTYTTYTNQLNPDLDRISHTLSGATRRNYTNTDNTVKVDCIVDTVTGDDNNDGLTMKTAYKTLTKAINMGWGRIGFIGYADSLTIPILDDTIIIGSGEQSKLENISFWIEPGAKLTLENLTLGDTLTPSKSVGNVSDKTILIKV